MKIALHIASDRPMLGDLRADPARYLLVGEITVEFLSACCRATDLPDTPENIIFFSGLID